MAEDGTSVEWIASAGNTRSVRMTVRLPDSDAARELLTYLGRSFPASAFTVECAAMTDSPPCVVVVDNLTDRQLATLAVAVERGYYDKPKDAQLSEIAAEFDCSASAISQRLTGAERKLVRSFVEACE